MTNNDKVKAIMDDIAINYESFQQQAKNKLKKQSKILDPNKDYRELVCDVVYSIIKKLDNYDEVNKYYKMYKEKKLNMYIYKCIDINSRYAKSPFLCKKIKELKKSLKEYNVEYIADEDINEKENEETILNERDFMFFYIMSLLERPHAKDLLGEDWKYYSTLFKEYYNNVESTYSSLEKKYGFPSSTLYRDIKYVKDKIKEHLKNNNMFLTN